MKKISPFKLVLMVLVVPLLSSCNLLTEVPNTEMSIGFLIQLALIVAIIAVVIMAYSLNANKS